MDVTAPVNVTEQLRNALCEKFDNVIVSQKELKTAQQRMKGQLFDSWEEKIVHDVTRGIPKENLEEFIEMVGDGLALDSEQMKQLVASLKPMKFAKSKESSILEMKFNVDNFRSVYGYVAMLKEEDGTLACSYAFHKLKFKLALKGMVTTTEKRFWFIPIGTTESLNYERQKFAEDDINAIKNAFSRHKALEILMKEGIIQKINYGE